MKFMLVITWDESQGAVMSDEELAQTAALHKKYVADLVAANKLLSGERLAPESQGTRVRVRRGQPTFTDGPFADTKEALGGFYVLECASREEAIAWAERCPSAMYGTVEVRPVLDAQG